MQQLPFDYRTKPYMSTGKSPFYLLYGRDARLPTETALETLLSPFVVDNEDYSHYELMRGLSMHGKWLILLLPVLNRSRRFGTTREQTLVPTKWEVV